VAKRDRNPRIYVLAGINGAGKSSIIGAMFLEQGIEYFNPDEAARRIRSANPGVTQNDANGAAWIVGKRLLERAVHERSDFAFETTLGGRTITALLVSALESGIEVRVWYVGLRSVQLHIDRVKARVARGGHNIPSEMIRKRYDSSRYNLVQLLPKLTELRVFDNSAEADPHAGLAPVPKLLLRVDRGVVASMCDLKTAPHWAQPILMAAMKLEK